jgi:hypothetical protein
MSPSARIPPGSSDLGAEECALPRADFRRLPVVDPVRSASPDAVTDVGHASIALAPGGDTNPRRARGRDVLAAPAAHRPRRTPEAELAPRTRNAPAHGSGSGRERPSPGVGTRRMPRCILVLEARRSEHPPRRHECRHGWNEDVGFQAPKDSDRTRRPRTRDAIRVAHTPSQRPRSTGVATDGDPMRSWDGDHTTRKRETAESCATPSSVLRRRCDPTQPGATSFSALPRPRARHDWSRSRRALEPSRHPETRGQPTLPGCAEMSPPPRRPRRRVAHRLTHRRRPQPALAAGRPPSLSQPRTSGWCSETTSRWPLSA